MLARTIKTFLGTWTLLVILSGCGETNLNGFLFVDDQAEGSYEALMEKSSILYDRGDFDGAQTAAEKAYAKNKDGELEEAGIQLAYVHLSQAGIDPFIIIKKLLSMSDEDLREEMGEEGCEPLGSSGDAGTTMQSLGCLINISDDDLAAMGEFDAGDSDFFSSDLGPVFIPEDPGEIGEEDAPRELISSIKHLNKAISYLCPFVNPATGDDATDVLIEGDVRHACDATTGNREFETKAHYVWGLAHLIEAVAFNNALLYSGGGTSAGLVQSSSGLSSNLLARVTAMQQAEVDPNNLTEFNEFAEAALEVSSFVDQVFDTSDTSMLRAILNDMQAASRGFGAMGGGLPEGMLSGINSAMDAIDNAASGASGGTEGALDNKTNSLRQKLNEDGAKKLAQKVNEIDDELDDIPGGPSDDQIENLQNACDSVEALAGGDTASIGVTLPSRCN